MIIDVTMRDERDSLGSEHRLAGVVSDGVIGLLRVVELDETKVAHDTAVGKLDGGEELIG